MGTAWTRPTPVDGARRLASLVPIVNDGVRGQTGGLKSVLTLAGHDRTAGGAKAVAGNLRVPTLMFAGSADTPALGGGGQSQDVWGTPKTNGGAVGRYALAWQRFSSMATSASCNSCSGQARTLPTSAAISERASERLSNLLAGARART